MTAPVTARSLFDSLGNRLKLTWIAGHDGGSRLIHNPAQTVSEPTLIGRANFIYASRIQIIGSEECHYLHGLDASLRNEFTDRLFASEPALVIVTDGRKAADPLVEKANATATPLLATAMSAGVLINDLEYYLRTLVADRTTVHGVFMEVMGMGTLLTGDCAVGKSELALELISRGHRLIADDAPEFSRVGPDALHGSCPDILRDFLEVRGLGILNVRAMFGDSVIKPGKYLRLIVNLVSLTTDELRDVDRLRGSRTQRNILGISVPEITLPVAPGRNLAVLIEVAVRDQILRNKGYEADKQLVKRQREYLERNNESGD